MVHTARDSHKKPPTQGLFCEYQPLHRPADFSDGWNIDSDGAKAAELHRGDLPDRHGTARAIGFWPFESALGGGAWGTVWCPRHTVAPMQGSPWAVPVCAGTKVGPPFVPDGTQACAALLSSFDFVVVVVGPLGFKHRLIGVVQGFFDVNR